MKRIFFAEDKALFRGCLALLLERRIGVEYIQAGPFADAHRALDNRLVLMYSLLVRSAQVARVPPVAP
jgi:hypothetical protein